MKPAIPGISISRTSAALLVKSDQPLSILSSGVVGGGSLSARHIINRHVDKNYDHPDPVADLHTYAVSLGINSAFVGMLTARYIHQGRAVTLSHEGLAVSAVITAGVSNTTSAGISQPFALQAGTINIILLINANLSSGALVNATITATEAKTHTLLERGLTTPEGHPATGTSTDAIVVACSGSGAPLDYAGPATPVGWLIGRAVRLALAAALDAPLDIKDQLWVN